MKEGKEGRKKRYGNRGTALEFMHTIPLSFYLLKSIHSILHKLQKRARRTGE